MEDYGAAIDLWEALRNRSGGQWLKTWCNDLAKAYGNRGMAYQRATNPNMALQDWRKAIDLSLEALRHDYWLASRVLLQCLSMTLIAHAEQENWAESAMAFQEFWHYSEELESAWLNSHMGIDPPWRDIVAMHWAQIYGFSPKQRAGFLQALGDDAEAVNKILGWEK